MSAIIEVNGIRPGEVPNGDPETMRKLLEKGAYNAPEYPPKPKRPLVLDKKAGDLTKEEAHNLSEVKEQWDKDYAAWEQVRSNLRSEEARLDTCFREDLRRAWLTYVVSEDKEQRAFNIAWDERHSSGLIEVFDFYGDLSELLH